MEYKALETEATLANEYKYKPLPPILSLLYRQLYLEHIPKGFYVEGDDVSVFSQKGTPICFGYERIVVGDYGAFIEFSPKQANKAMFKIKPGQEYRINDERFADRVKYHWLTVDDKSDIKIYYQQKTVAYADYKPGMYYISPHECSLAPERLNDMIAAAGKKNKEVKNVNKSSFERER